MALRLSFMSVCVHSSSHCDRQRNAPSGLRSKALDYQNCGGEILGSDAAAAEALAAHWGSTFASSGAVDVGATGHLVVATGVAVERECPRPLGRALAQRSLRARRPSLRAAACCSAAWSSSATASWLAPGRCASAGAKPLHATSRNGPTRTAALGAQGLGRSVWRLPRRSVGRTVGQTVGRRCRRSV